MKESKFIEENKEDWKRLEDLLEGSTANPRVLRNLFVKVSGDLSYARTHYPNRRVRLYLNGLINELFDKMRIRKRPRIASTIVRFYQEILPNEIIRNKNAFFLSAFVFLASIGIGIYSTYVDPEFFRLILGDEYANMTIENIDQGDPMAVYKFENASLGFLRITVNNIQVAFLAFGLGLFFGLGTVFVLIRNGIMLGAFQSFFAIKGLFLTSFLTIWIHGTLEISSIIVAGAAGLILGRSLIFPRTYTRKASLSQGAISALMIMLSTVPLFILAGFLEGFVTRHTELPDIAKVFILLVSAAIILGIYVIYPYLYYHRGYYRAEPVFILPEEKKILESNRTLSILEMASKQYIDKAEMLFRQVVLPLTFLIAGVFLCYFKLKEMGVDSDQFAPFDFKDSLKSPLGIGLFFIFSAYLVTQTSAILNKNKASLFSGFQVIQKNTLPLLLLLGFFLFAFLSPSHWLTILIFIFVPIMGLLRMVDHTFNPRHQDSLDFREEISKGNQLLNSVVGTKVTIVVILFLLSVALTRVFKFIVLEFISWHPILEYSEYQTAFWSIVFTSFILLLVYPYLHLILSLKLERKVQEYDCVDLYDQFQDFQRDRK